VSVRRRELYLGEDEDGRLIAVVGADGKRLEGVVEARPLWQELVFRVFAETGVTPEGLKYKRGPSSLQTRKMPFKLVHAVTGEVIDDRGAAR